MRSHTHCLDGLPCSLRVNLDMGKAVYGWMIMRDENIPGTVVRTSTIPEELGRLVYLLTDKTGTGAHRAKWAAGMFMQGCGVRPYLCVCSCT